MSQNNKTGRRTIRRYSGPGSKKFWQRINKVPFGYGGHELYVMGCILQDVEGKVLRLLEEFEQKSKKKRGKK